MKLMIEIDMAIQIKPYPSRPHWPTLQHWGFQGKVQHSCPWCPERGSLAPSLTLVRLEISWRKVSYILNSNINMHSINYI